jgi:hypothetical protein
MNMIHLKNKMNAKTKVNGITVLDIKQVMMNVMLVM